MDIYYNFVKKSVKSSVHQEDWQVPNLYTKGDILHQNFIKSTFGF